MKVKRTNNYSDSPPLNIQYENIMRNFDFDRVHEFMNWEKSKRSYDDEGNCIDKSSWKMFVAPSIYKIPDISELRDCASRLLKGVMKVKETSKAPVIFMATGPFKAIYRYGILELDCIIGSWSDD